MLEVKIYVYENIECSFLTTSLGVSLYNTSESNQNGLWDIEQTYFNKLVGMCRVC